MYTENSITYQKYVRPNAHTFLTFKISNDDIRKANQWALAMEEAKMKEFSWQKDYGSALKRLATGALGEMVLERFLGKSFIDWSIGVSTDYDKPDMLSLGVNIGVKTVEFIECEYSGIDKFPIVYKDNKYPQIFNFYKPQQQVMYLCGIASPEILNKYQSDSLILSQNLKSKNVKSAFYGFIYMDPPSKIEEYLNNPIYQISASN